LRRHECCLVPRKEGRNREKGAGLGGEWHGPRWYLA
jgi:hypothetical protein